MDFCWLEVDQINFFHNWEHYSSPKYPPNIPFYVKGISLSSFFWYFPLVSLGWGIWLLCGFGRWIAYACLSPSCPFIIQAIPAYREQVFFWTSLSCKKYKIGPIWRSPWVLKATWAWDCIWSLYYHTYCCCKPKSYFLTLALWIISLLDLSMAFAIPCLSKLQSFAVYERKKIFFGW